ncbi:MAG TPA: hypothetical protein PKA98_02020 [Acidimicrobiales bacterium]|nr:hypothetical protein [Acidimicrobiales bacterium]
MDLGTGRTATAVSASEASTCAVLDNGNVKCWGFNSSGQLGLGDTLPRGDEPCEMGDVPPTVALGTGRTATTVTAGHDDTNSSSHTCATLDNGQVKCWGGNHYGQLGLGDTATRGRSPGRTGDSLPGTIELLGALAGTVTDGNGTPLAGTLIAALAPGNYRAVIVHPLSGQFEYGIDGAAYVDAAVFPVTAGHDAPVDAEL